MARNAFRAGLETLERRETPAPLAPTPIPFRGSGTGLSTGLIPTPVPGFFLGAPTLNGTVDGLGSFVGQESGTVTINRNANLTANLVFQNGDTLALRLRGKVRDGVFVSRPLTAHLNFRVIGGTGSLALASGHGTLEGILDTSSGVFDYTFRGQIRHGFIAPPI